MTLKQVLLLLHIFVDTSAVQAANVPTSACDLTTSSIETYSRQADVVFGGLVSVNVETIFPANALLFTEPPGPLQCTKFSTEFYASILAMVFATEEINRNANILPNTTLGFQVYDSCFSDARALKGTLWMHTGKNKTVPNYTCQPSRRNLAAFIGDTVSAGAVAMARILGVSRFPQISFAASLATLSDKRLFPSFLRTVTSVSFQPGAVVEVLLHFGWTWVGVLASNNEFGIQGIQNLKKEAEKKDICIEFLETLPTQSSLSHIVTVIRRSSAKVIVCYAFAAHIIPILREVTVQGISDKVWLGIGSWFSTTVMSKRDLWETMNGTLGLSGYSGQIPGLKKFLYSIHPSKITGDIFLKSFWEYAFTCTLLGGLNTTDGRGMCTGKENVTLLDSSLYEVHSFRHPYYAYNAVYLLAQALHDLLSCKPQEGPFINNSCADPQNFHPWQMLHYVKNSCIRNSAGEEVFFDANGDSPPLMDLLYWHMTSRDTSQFVKVGTYNANRPPGYKLTINNSAIYWGGKYPQVPLSVCSKSCAPGYRKSLIEGRPRCCFSCVPCPDGSINNQTDSIYCVKCPEDQWSNNEKDSCLPKEIEFLSYGEPLGFIFSLLSLFLFFNATGTFCIFIRYRHTPVVRANNLQLSYILLVALMLCFLCSLVFIGQPRKVTCMFRQVIFGISFSLAISCVLAKTITVVIAFRATQPNSNLRRWIGSRTSSSIVLLCSFIEIAIGVIWLLTSPPFPELNNNATYWKIGAECNEGSISMFYCMLAYLGLLACISFGVAFLSRNLPDSFNEAKFITFSMIVFVSVWLSFIPAYLSTKGKYLVAVEIFAILSSGAGLLYCIYAPKVYIIFLRPEMNTREFFARKSTMTSRTA